MNLLPFTSIILVILTIVSLTFFRSHYTFKSQASVLCNLFSAERKTRNSLATKDYIKRTPKKKSKETEGKKPHKITRPTKNFTHTAKLNLAHLHIPAIRNAALSLLTTLYANAPVDFDPKGFLEDLPKKLSTVKDWTKLLPFELQKGTERAYPPISKFFYYDEKKEPIYFRVAAKEVIEAYFGNKLAEEIFALEQDASTLTEDALQPLTRNIDGLCFKVLMPKINSVEETSQTVTIKR